jgi:TonB family protein
MGNRIAVAGVGPLVLEQGLEPEPRRRRRKRRRHPRPFEAGGPSWEKERQLGATRLRRSAIISLALHVVLAVVVMVALRPRTRPQVRLQGIPVQLVSIASPPPSLRSKPKAAEVAVQVVREDKPKAKSGGKPVPVKKNAQPVPSKNVKKSPPPAAGSHPLAADSTKVLRSEVALGDGALGALEIGTGGELSEYSYYLMAVRDKISSYWNPPAGLSTKGREIAATVAFRIDRRGNIATSYVEEPSGTGVFDAAGLRAVGQADPLPPLPQGFPGDYVGIHLRFVYQD